MNYVLQERLRELRSIHKLSQTEVASRLGISTSAYGYYEQGKNTPSPDTLIALSSMFNVSVDYLIGNSDVMNYKEEPEEIAILDIHKQEEINKHGEKGIEDRFVFTNSCGNHVGSASFRNYYREFCKKHGLKYVTPYGLRHTAATILALNNIPLINISNKLRHRNVRTTEIYTHAVDSINDLMNNTLIDTISGGEIGGES